MKWYKIRKRYVVALILFFYSGIFPAAVSPNIEVDFVYKICPVYTVYSNMFLEGFEGVNKGFINFIPPYNKGTTVKIHEMTHSKQAYRSCFLSPVLCSFSEDYLAKSEAEAYASEFTNPAFINMYATLIHDLYTPSIPIKTIENYIREFL